MPPIDIKNIACGPLYAAAYPMRAAKRANRTIIAENVRMLMQRRGWNQRQLGDKAGLSQTHVGNVLREHSDVSTSVLESLGVAFGIPGWLLLVPDLRADILDSPEIPAMVARYAGFHAEPPKNK